MWRTTNKLTLDLIAITSVAGLWVAMVMVDHPGGEFPLADDWAYASSVRALLTRGAIELRPWTPAIALSHTLYGALWSQFFGFSFQTLRSSILCLGFVGVVATYGLVRELGARPRFATLGALTLAANPIYFYLAGTFMTDVSFVAMATLALWPYSRALRTGSVTALWLGTLSALAATLDRQIGIAIPFGLAIAVLATKTSLRRVDGILPLVLALASLGLWELFVRRHGGPVLGANVKMDEVFGFLHGTPVEVAGHVLRNGFVLVLYLGLFTLPFALVAGSALEGEERQLRRAKVWGRVLIGAVVGGYVVSATLKPMPILVGNILLPSGIGGATLRDTHILALPHLPEVPWALRCAFTMLSVLGVLAIGLVLAAAGRSTATNKTDHEYGSVNVFLAVVGALWIAPDLIAPYFDRYLLPLIPIVIGLTVEPLRRRSSGEQAHPLRVAELVAVLLLVATSVFSVVAVHDYLSWNRARWEAGDWLLTTLGASPSEIDGGFEWNAWHLYDPDYVVSPDKSWWWVRGDRFVIAFGPIEGRQTVHRVEYPRWLPPGGAGELLVLERSPSP